MKYLSSKELSEKWGISQRRIVRLAQENRIEGAHLYGKSWLFPEDAGKPEDGRTRHAKSTEQNDQNLFRYPDFAYRNTAFFNPPLTSEELKIKAIEEAFFSCRFDEATELFNEAVKVNHNKYHRIYFMYIGCMIEILSCNIDRFFEYYGKLTAEFQEDFPHKIEMQSLVYELNSSLDSYDHFKNHFYLDSSYDYHESYLPHLASLCAFVLSATTRMHPSPEALISYELNSVFLEYTESPVDLQNMHLYLGIAYSVMGETDAATRHIRQALILANKYELYYSPAVEYYYFSDVFESALSGFSQEFVSQFQDFSNDIHDHFVHFMQKISTNNFFRTLTKNDYIYVFYAAKGLTNKEIAGILHKRESAVGMRFSSIYNRLGINSKKELIEMYNTSIKIDLLDKRKMPHPVI